MLSLYKGKTFHIWSSHKNHVNTTVLVKKKHNWTRGTLFLIASCLGYSFWFLAQVKIFFNHMIWLYINFIYFHVSLSLYIYILLIILLIIKCRLNCLQFSKPSIQLLCWWDCLEVYNL